jgi:hypothetical protein
MIDKVYHYSLAIDLPVDRGFCLLESTFHIEVNSNSELATEVIKRINNAKTEFVDAFNNIEAIKESGKVYYICEFRTYNPQITIIS